MKHYKKLCMAERENIEVFLRQGYSIYQIAKLLNRSYPCIYYEVQKNLKVYPDADGNTCSFYLSSLAQSRADSHKLLSVKPIKLKENKELYNLLVKALNKKISPELFSIRMKLLHPDNKHYAICYESIYQFIYRPENTKLNLKEKLIRAHKKRYPKNGRKSRKPSKVIKEYVSIDERPKQINNRKRLGNFEADSVESPHNSSGYGVHVLTDRKVRMYFARIVKDLSSKECLKAEDEILSNFDPSFRNSITYDNGKENYLHYKLKEKYGLDTYFCHSYSSWEKGTVERQNGVLRQYFPKGTDFGTITQNQLNEVLNEMNSRPMKALGGLSPIEAWAKELDKLKQNGKDP